MIPDFDNNGQLPKGIHLCSADDFLDRFFFNDYRASLKKSFTDILDWAKDRNAIDIFVGGSFITNENKPNDIDCLIVFSDEASIPHKSEILTILSTKVDIQFSAKSDADIVPIRTIRETLSRFGTGVLG